MFANRVTRLSVALHFTPTLIISVLIVVMLMLGLEYSFAQEEGDIRVNLSLTPHLNYGAYTIINISFEEYIRVFTFEDPEWRPYDTFFFSANGLSIQGGGILSEFIRKDGSNSKYSVKITAPTQGNSNPSIKNMILSVLENSVANPKGNPNASTNISFGFNVRALFNPSSYFFGPAETQKIRIKLQKYKPATGWLSVPLKPIGFSISDISVSQGTLSNFDFNTSSNPTEAFVFLTAPKNIGSNTIELTIKENVFGDGIKTNPFVASYSFGQKHLEVDLKSKSTEFVSRNGKIPVKLKVFENGNSVPYYARLLDGGDFITEVYDVDGNIIQGGKSRISSFGFGSYTRRYDFVLHAPSSLSHLNGKVILKLNEDALVDLPLSTKRDIKAEYEFDYTGDDSIKLINFFLICPRQAYYVNGQGSDPDPFFEDLDFVSVIIGVKWSDYVTGVNTDDFEVEIDWAGDTHGYVTVEDYISIPNYPKWYTDAIDAPIGKTKQEFKLKIPESGSGTIIVFIKTNAADNAANTRLQLGGRKAGDDSWEERLNFFHFGPE